MNCSRSLLCWCFAACALIAVAHAVEPTSKHVQASNHTDGKPPNEEPAHVHPFNAVLCLFILGVNVASQRSGADHFADVHLSPARTSPFICLADMLVTILWIVRGVFVERLGMEASAKMLVKDFGFSEEEDTMVLGRRWPLNIIVMIVFIAGALFEGIKLFAFGATGTAPWLQTFAAAMFFAAYIFRVFVNTLSRRCNDADTIHRLEETKEGRQRLFVIADTFYDLAYSTQFHFWIETFGNLKFFSEPKAVVVVTSLAMIIFPALTSYFFPVEEPEEGRPAPTRWHLPQIYHGRWSFNNWGTADQNRAYLVLFVIGIIIPFDFDLIWRIILVPLAAFAVAVLCLTLASVVRMLIARPRANNNVPGPPEPENQDPGLAEEELRPRLNPLLRAKTASWRNTVSSAFALANFTFVCMYYFGVYDASKTVKPSWLEIF